MSSLARNIATEADNTVIMRDTAIDDTAVSRSTVLDYLQVLERLMIIENLPAWRTHIRSAATLRKAPKRHFCDPSVACMALGLSPDRLLEDLEYTGFLFESAVIHDLRVYAQALGGQLYHYRDSNRWEADAIIELRDGSWAPVEVKLGFGAVGEAAASVSRVADNVDQSKTGPLLGKLVITGSGFAHRRPDGVTVVPLAVLGP
jgi:predicted AAA+ superfamily ATPase